MIFAQFDKENKGGLYYRDMVQLMIRNRNVRDTLLCLLPCCMPRIGIALHCRHVVYGTCTQPGKALPASVSRPGCMQRLQPDAGMVLRRFLTRSAGRLSSWSGPPCGCWSPTKRCGCFYEVSALTRGLAF
jgi:hypothetical protein